MIGGAGYAFAALLCWGLSDFIYKNAIAAGVNVNEAGSDATGRSSRERSAAAPVGRPPPQLSSAGRSGRS